MADDYPSYQPQNPLAMVAQYAQIANAVQQNRLIQKTMAAKQATGNALAHATGADGMINYPQAMTEAAKNPDAAYGYQDFATNAQDQQQKQFTYEMQHYTAIRQTLAPIAEMKNPTYQDFVNAGANLINVDPSAFTSKVIAGELQQIKALNPSDDPDTYRQIARHYRDQAMTAEQQITAHHQMQYQNIGGQQVPVNMAPEADTPPTLTNTMGPADANSPVQAFDVKNGQPVVTTKAALAQAGSMPSGPPLGAEAGANQSAAASAQAAAALPNRVAQATQTKAALELMRGDLQNMPATGPSMSALQHMKTLASEWLPGGTGMTEQEIASTAGFKKLAAQIVAAQYQGQATGSDKVLGNIVAGNPSTDLSTLSNKRLIDYMEAAQDMTKAEGAAWEKNKAAGYKDQHFNDFHSWFNQNVDPRMFMAKYQTPEERAQSTANMSPAEKAKFFSTMKELKSAGLIK